MVLPGPNAAPSGARATVAVMLPAVSGNVAVPFENRVQVNEIESMAVKLAADRLVTSTVVVGATEVSVPEVSETVLALVMEAVHGVNAEPRLAPVGIPVNVYSN